jgi:hypothetical protein
LWQVDAMMAKIFATNIINSFWQFHLLRSLELIERTTFC